MANHRKLRSTEKFISRSSLQQKSGHSSNTVRIIGGEWRGRKLSFPNIDGLRPTGDRMRETLFNWLSTKIHDSQVIDLFAGSGSLGFESLSRGAGKVTFIEANNLATQSIEKNIALLSASKANVQEVSAFDYLQSAQPGSCDLLFLDPPFAEELHNPILKLIDHQKTMKPDGTVYIEAPLSASVTIPAGWTVHRKKVSGQIQYLLCYC